MGKLLYEVSESRKVRYIIHTDCKNEADDQYTVAHCLLTPMLDVKGIVAAHFNKCSGRFPEGTTATESYKEVVKILDLMDMKDQYPVLIGAEVPLTDENTPVPSAGADFIIKEAMKDDERPLYIGLQGSLTDLASAILIEPKICHKMTAIWIGGAHYPEGGEEFNLMQDVKAANVVMKSEMPLWQIPSNVYKDFPVSLAELQCRVMPYGKIGEYLFKQLVTFNKTACDRMPDFDWPHGEVWGLGDEGVLAALMHEKQRTTLYHMEKAPNIDYESMKYLPGETEKTIRVYDRMDSRLTIEDLYCKLSIFSDTRSN